MKNYALILLIALFVNCASFTAAHAQDIEKDAGNPNNSSFPESNQPGAPPNEPDPSHSIRTHMLPNNNLPDGSGTTSEPAPANGSN